MGKVIDKTEMFTVLQRKHRAQRVATMVDTAADALDRCNKHPSWALCTLCDPEFKPD